MKEILIPSVIAIFMAAVLISTGAAKEIINGFGSAMGGLGILLAVVIIFSLIFAGFKK